jgi:hypothetical protein
VAGDSVRLDASGPQNLRHHKSRRVKSGLGDLSTPELIFRTLTASFQQIPLQAIACLLKKGAGFREILGQVDTHADGLRTLTRKNECEFHGFPKIRSKRMGDALG